MSSEPHAQSSVRAKPGTHKRTECTEEQTNSLRVELHHALKPTGSRYLH